MRVCRECGIKIEGRNTLFCESCRVERRKRMHNKTTLEYQARVRDGMLEKFNFNQLTDDDKKMLLFLSPGPLGLGMNVSNAAKLWGISRRTMRDKINRFKAHFPEGWENFLSMWRAAHREADSLNNSMFHWDDKYEDKDNWNMKNKF